LRATYIELMVEPLLTELTNVHVFRLLSVIDSVRLLEYGLEKLRIRQFPPWVGFREINVKWIAWVPMAGDVRYIIVRRRTDVLNVVRNRHRVFGLPYAMQFLVAGGRRLDISKACRDLPPPPAWKPITCLVKLGAEE
jgi:hypothetical protein